MAKISINQQQFIQLLNKQGFNFIFELLTFDDEEYTPKLLIMKGNNTEVEINFYSDVFSRAKNQKISLKNLIEVAQGQSKEVYQALINIRKNYSLRKYLRPQGIEAD